MTERPSANRSTDPPGHGWVASLIVMVGIFGFVYLWHWSNPPAMPAAAALQQRFDEGIRSQTELMDETGAEIAPVPATYETTLCRVIERGSKLWSSDPLSYICLARGRSATGPVYFLHDFRKINPVNDEPVRWSAASFHLTEWAGLMARHDLHPADLPPSGTDPIP